MTSSTFGALTAARELKAAGIEADQAEAIAAWLRAAARTDHDTVATKADLAVLKADLAARGARMYRALWIQGGAIVAILTALRFLPI